MNSLCAWCSCGIEEAEKFCSQCGGPNVNFLDLKHNQLPITNIGQRIIEFKISKFVGTYHWNTPRIGILRRLIISTNRQLENVKIIINGSVMLVDQKPRGNEFIYTGKLDLETTHDVSVNIETKFEQEARITLETDMTLGYN